MWYRLWHDVDEPVLVGARGDQQRPAPRPPPILRTTEREDRTGRARGSERRRWTRSSRGVTRRWWGRSRRRRPCPSAPTDAWSEAGSMKSEESSSPPPVAMDELGLGQRCEKGQGRPHAHTVPGNERGTYKFTKGKREKKIRRASRGGEPPRESAVASPPDYYY